MTLMAVDDARPRFPASIESRVLRSALTTTEHVLKGARAHFFLLAAGSGQLIVEDGNRALQGPCGVWLPEGRATRLFFDAGARGAAVSAPPALIGRAAPSGAFDDALRALIQQPLVLRDLQGAHVRRLEALIEMISSEIRENLPEAEAAMRNCLSLLLIEIWRAPGLEAARARPSKHNLAAAFLHIVDAQLTEHWTVQRYASELGVSKDQLATLVVRATGRSPLAHIHARMLSEAKNLLANTDYQVAEIAYRLGFTDAAYFSRFFRRNEGMSPGRYRKGVSAARATVDPSFHAWP